MSETVIRCRGLSRDFGQLRAVDHIDLDIPKACIYGFLGPNGCGKSTIMRMLTGLLTPTEGDVEVLGYRLPDEAEALRQRIGYMTQRFSLYGNLSVEENLQFVAKIYGLSHPQRQRRVSELLDLYELGKHRQQLSNTMSGGQRQRLALAAATLHQPDLLILDEPTAAVDPENRREFWERLFDLCSEGKTLLVSTHYMDEAERCHQLAILDRGVKKTDGSPDALMAAIGARVFELDGQNLRQLKSRLLAEPDVVSAAQLGTRLRVLINAELPAPLHVLRQHCSDRQIQEVRPSLEDVFVIATRRHHG